jgi:hypothetical protein
VRSKNPKWANVRSRDPSKISKLGGRTRGQDSGTDCIFEYVYTYTHRYVECTNRVLMRDDTLHFRQVQRSRVYAPCVSLSPPLYCALCFCLVPEDYPFVQFVGYRSRCSHSFGINGINSSDSCCHAGRMPFSVRRSLVGFLVRARRNSVICPVFDSRHQESAC